MQQGALLQQVITSLRDVRTKNQLKPKDPIELFVLSQQPGMYQATQSILCRQLNATSFQFAEAPVANSISAVVEKDKFFLVAEQAVDAEAQKAALLKDLDYYKGFLESVRKKLGNERFVQNAKPEVVELERRKEADALEKIKAIEESLQLL